MIFSSIVSFILVLMLFLLKRIRKNQKVLLKRLEEMNVDRTSWMEKSLSLLPEDQDSVLSFATQQVKTAQAALSAAQSTAAIDWGWGDSTDTLLLYEWGFETAMDQYFLIAHQSTANDQEKQAVQEKEKLWHDSQAVWNAERSQVTAIAEKYNKTLVFPFHPLLSRFFPKATIWMSKKQYQGFTQTSRNSL